jgi:transcription-repair coupling factor (superfamily II helicase)
LIQWIGTKGGLVKLRPDQKLSLVRDMDVAARMAFARDLLANLVRIAKAPTP